MRNHWRLLTFSLVWLLVLFGLGLYAALNGKATTKEQRTIEQSRPAVERAASDVLTAASPSVAAQVSGFELRAECKITPARRGSSYQRVIDLYVPEGQEKPLLEKLRANLPAAYSPRVIADILTADADDFVRITGTIAGPGRVHVASYTGCRGYVAGVSSEPVAQERKPVEAVFTSLGVVPQEWVAHQVGCATTTVGTATGGVVGSLPSRFAGRELLVSTDNRVVYRDAGATVVVKNGDGEGGGEGSVVVTRTVGCG